MGFFSSFLRRDSLTNVSPLAGKFRSYLLACLKHFLAKERRRTQAQRCGAGVQQIPLDGETAETRYLAEPADNLTPPELRMAGCLRLQQAEKALTLVRIKQVGYGKRSE